ncbi:MAG: cation-transporting P-type ATPase [Acidimicrobiia bacterium]
MTHSAIATSDLPHGAGKTTALEVSQTAGLPPQEVMELLGTTPRGLGQAEVERRRAQYGPNTVSPAPRPRLLRRFSANFGHLMAILLWVAGGVALIAGLPELAVAVWVVNVINGLFSAWQEHKAEQATRALLQLLPTTALVVRDGQPEQIEAIDLVPGDIVILEEGDHVSVDGRLVESVNLRVDQSTLTGESRPVHKASRACATHGLNPLEIPNLVFAGTTVSAGRGRLVATDTGDQTRIGAIAGLTQGLEETLSPLQVEMRRLSVTVSIVALAVGGVFFFLGLGLGVMPPAEGFIFALGMIVAFVPEGLLPTVTLALAMGTQRMAKRNALVKKLSSVETLGSTTVICTDKTGTLTANQMTVREVALAGGRVYRFSGVGYKPVGSVTPHADEGIQRLLTSAALASNARLRQERDEWTVVGDPMEGALLVATLKVGLDPVVMSRQWPRLREVPFDPNRKLMSTVNRVGEEMIVMVKGAPDALLPRCDTMLTPDGSLPLTAGALSNLEEQIETSARQGLRVLGVARRALVAIPDNESEMETGLEFLGLVAMHDPPRPEVEVAIGKCRSAGIRTILITGDHGVTAESIGRRTGIIDPGPIRIVNGVEIDVMSDKDLDDVLERDVLFARATPEHKLRVVKALQTRGDVVAVTGDGVNDAPALKRADIGVAMGASGTDVAREAADMILLDDNFASIVAAIEEGRAVYENIKKFTTYILTSNTPEAIPFMVFAFSGGSIPLALGVMHILAVDLGTDLAPALALGAEKPEPDVMRRPPRSLSNHLVDRRLLTRAYVWLGPLQAAFVMAAFFGAYRLAGHTGWLDLPAEGTVYASATAMAFAAVVATQIGNLFAQRSQRISVFRMGLGGNRLLWWGILTEVGVLAAIVYVPFMQDLIGTAPFPPEGWLWLLLGIPLLPMADEVRKVVLRWREGGR